MSESDKFERAVVTLTSMLIDYKMGGIDRETLISNLKIYTKAMEWYNQLPTGQNNE